MKKGNIFGSACCLVLDVLSVRCFVDFQVEMLSKKFEKGVWNLRESLRLDYWLGDCQHKEGYFKSEDQMRSARDWVRIEKSKAFAEGTLICLQVKGMRRNSGGTWQELLSAVEDSREKGVWSQEKTFQGEEVAQCVSGYKRNTWIWQHGGQGGSHLIKEVSL